MQVKFADQMFHCVKKALAIVNPTYLCCSGEKTWLLKQ